MKNKKVETNVRPVRAKYSHAIADAKKARKREEAEKRQKDRKKKTDKQQLTKLDATGCRAKKERARLKG